MNSIRQLLSEYRNELEKWKAIWHCSAEGSRHQVFCEARVSALEDIVARLRVCCLEEDGRLTGAPR